LTGPTKFGNTGVSGISTKCSADASHAPEIRQTIELGGRTRAACVARRPIRAVPWPDTPQISEWRGFWPRGRTGTPMQPPRPRCGPSNFTTVRLGGGPARYPDHIAILEGRHLGAVLWGRVPKPGARCSEPWRVYARRRGAAAMNGSEMMDPSTAPLARGGEHREFGHVWTPGRAPRCAPQVAAWNNGKKTRVAGRSQRTGVWPKISLNRLTEANSADRASRRVKPPG
jgi:hypothetical protein